MCTSSIIHSKVHYQFLTTILKFLLHFYGEDSSNNYASHSSTISEAITSIQYYPLGRITHESLWNWTTDIVSLYQKKTKVEVEEIATATTVSSKTESEFQALCCYSKVIKYVNNSFFFSCSYYFC